METLYVVEQGTYLKKRGNSLAVVKQGQTIKEVPAEGLKRLTLVGYVNLTGPVLDFLIRNRIETVFLTPTGRYRSRLVLDEHQQVRIRQAQYLQLNRPAFVLKTARILVMGKAQNMHSFLKKRVNRYGDRKIRQSAARIKGIVGEVGKSGDLDKIRGWEGLASKIYFGCFPQLIRNDRFKFNGRNRNPPLDPVNALLSFVYTLLTNEVLSAIKSVGLDPYLGALHDVVYGRPSLACDLVEEYRSFLGDRLVLTLINQQAITVDDFIYRNQAKREQSDQGDPGQGRPVEMKPAVCRLFITSYEKLMAETIMYQPLGEQISNRWVIHNQVKAYAQYLQEEGKIYRPFSITA